MAGRNFPVRSWRPDVKDKKIVHGTGFHRTGWQTTALFQYDHWFENEAMQEGHVKEEYDRVIEGFDKVLT